MAEKKGQFGQELIDMDEKGVPIKKKDKKEKEDKKLKSSKIFELITFLIIVLLLSVFFAYYFLTKEKNFNIFDETQLKNLKLKNRIFFGGYFNNSFKDGKFTEEALEKFENLAKNDVSIIVTGSACVGDCSPSLMEGLTISRIDSDEYIEEFKKLAKIVHKYNKYIFLQIAHMGLYSIEDIIYSPSGGKGFNRDIESKEMTKEDILRVQDYFTKAAIRAKKAGYDGIQIHASNLCLISLFLSKEYNKRTDEYGGSYIKRAKFFVEIVKKIRENIGNDMIISAKVDFEHVRFGFPKSEPIALIITAKLLEEAGIDIIEVNVVNPMKKGELFLVESASILSRKLKIPVSIIGGIKTYKQANFVLNEFKIKYISLASALMNEPDLVKKWHKNK